MNPLCTRLLAVYDILVGQKIVTKANAAPTANPPLNNIPSAEPEDQRGSGSVKKNDPEQDKDKLDQLQPPGDQSEASKVETEAEVVVTEPHGKGKQSNQLSTVFQKPCEVRILFKRKSTLPKN